MATRSRPRRRREKLPAYPGPAPSAPIPPAPREGDPARTYPEVPDFANDDIPWPPKDLAAHGAWFDETAARMEQETQGSTARAELERQADASVADAQKWAGWRTVALHTRCKPGEYPVTTTIKMEPQGGYAIMQRSKGQTKRLHGGFRDLVQAERVFEAVIRYAK